MRVFHYYSNEKSFQSGLSWLYYQIYYEQGIDLGLPRIKEALKKDVSYEDANIEVIADGDYFRIYLKCLDKRRVK